MKEIVPRFGPRSSQNNPQKVDYLEKSGKALFSNPLPQIGRNSQGVPQFFE